MVQKDNDRNYLITVGTRQYLLEEMNQEKTNFIRPRIAMIIGKKLTKEILTEAIQIYAEDTGYWLKLYHFADSIDISILNKLETEFHKGWKKSLRLRVLRKPAARIVVKLDPTNGNSDIVAFGLRSNEKDMENLATVVNSQCDIKIKINPKAY